MFSTLPPDPDAGAPKLLNSTRARILIVVAGGLIYFVLAAASVRTFWLPSGFALAMMLRLRGLGLALSIILGTLAIIIGEVLYDFFFGGSGWPWWAVATISIANGAAAGLGAYLVSLFDRQSARMDTVARLLTIIGIGGLAAMAPASATGAWLVHLMGSKRDFGTIWIGWQLRDVLGVILTAPVVLAWSRPAAFSETLRNHRRQWEAGALVAGTLVMSLSPIWSRVDLADLVRIGVIPFALWSCLRFGVRGVTAVNLIVGLAWGWLAANGIGIDDPMAHVSPVSRNLELQVSVASCTLFALIPAIVVQAQGETKHRLRLILEAISEGIVVHDGRGRLLEANPAARWLLGDNIELSGLVGAPQANSCTWWEENGNLLPAGEHPTVVTLRTGVGVKGRVLQYADQRGPTWVTVSTAPLQDEQGRVAMVVSTMADVSQQRATNEQLRQSQKMEVVGSLAGGIAHDFNNILTAMSLGVQVFKAKHPQLQDVQTYARSLQSMIRRAAALTGQLLLFARRSKPQKRPFALNANVSALLKILRPTLGEKLKIQLELAKDSIVILGDASLIDQVIMNLSINGRDAMPEGGLLTIRTELRKVTNVAGEGKIFLDARPGWFAEISIRDNGTGIPPEAMAHLFEPFFTTKEVGKGTGLGLSIVHSVVQQHQGWIRVRTKPGEGTEFSIFLPAAIGEMKEPVEDRKLPEGKGTLLIVEDEKIVRESCAAMLRALGYNVLEARNGPEALERWDQHKGQVELVISDMVMPGRMTGLEIYEQLRTKSAALKAILVSGYHDEIARSDHLQSESVVILPKPYDMADLTSAIQKQLAS